MRDYMNGVPWILTGIIVGVVVLGIGMVVVLRKRKEPSRVDYRNYFVMGVIWIPTGIILSLVPWLLHGEEPFFMGLVFLMMGLAYTAIGLVNREKWGRQVEISHAADRGSMILAVVAGGLLLLGLAVFVLLR